MVGVSAPQGQEAWKGREGNARGGGGNGGGGSGSGSEGAQGENGAAERGYDVERAEGERWKAGIDASRRGPMPARTFELTPPRYMAFPPLGWRGKEKGDQARGML